MVGGEYSNFFNGFYSTRKQGILHQIEGDRYPGILINSVTVTRVILGYDTYHLFQETDSHHYHKEWCHHISHVKRQLGGFCPDILSPNYMGQPYLCVLDVSSKQLLLLNISVVFIFLVKVQVVFHEYLGE